MTTQTAPTTVRDDTTMEESGRIGAIGATVSNAAETVKGAATEAAARLPAVAATTRSVIEDANREMRSGSDEMLVVGSALTFGLASGLLLGGGHRLLVAAALMPAALLVLTVLDRSTGTGERAKRRLQGS